MKTPDFEPGDRPITIRTFTRVRTPTPVAVRTISTTYTAEQIEALARLYMRTGRSLRATVEMAMNDPLLWPEKEPVERAGWIMGLVEDFIVYAPLPVRESPRMEVVTEWARPILVSLPV